MPIFISRFSPDRGLVGLLQVSRAGGRPEEQGAAQEIPPAKGAERAAVQQSKAQARQAARETEQEQAREKTDKQAGEADSRRAVDGRDGLTAVGNTGLAFALSTRRVQAGQQTQEAGSAQKTARRTPETRVVAGQNDRTEAAQARHQARAVDQAEKGRNGRGDLKAIRDNNQEAAGGAGRADMEGVAQRLRGLLQGDETARRTGREGGPATRLVITTGAGADEAAQGTEQQGKATEGRQSNQTGGDSKGAALPPAEAQREEVRGVAREVGRGLQRDASIQNSRNAEKTARSAARATEGGQRQEAQRSQSEARALQSEHRRLQQEMRQTEQQIRQLQGRAGGGGAAAAKAASALAAGSNVNILAQ